MERKLASVRRIGEIIPIEGADAIEAVYVDGWAVVVKKGEFKPGDLCIYFEIDSILPIKPEYEFLRKGCYRKADWIPNGEGFRLRTIKLRGQVSQGLVVPIPAGWSRGFIDGASEDIGYMKIGSTVIYMEGADVTELLGVVKWDPPVPACLAGQMRGNFPSFIPKTDQERVQNIWKKLPKDMTFEVTEKLDGSSCTVYHKDGYVGICSRNLDLEMSDCGNSFISRITSDGIAEKMATTVFNVAIQGELIGPGIQNNRYGLKETEFRLFDVYYIDEARYATPDERQSFVDWLGCKHAPILGYITLDSFESNGGLQALIASADGASVLNGSAREGLVFKSASGVSFKVISNVYLAKGFDE